MGDPIYDTIMGGEVKTATRLATLTIVDGAITAVSADTPPFNEDFHATIARTLEKAEAAEDEEFSKDLIGGIRSLVFKASKKKLKPQDGSALSAGDSNDTVSFEIANSSVVLDGLWAKIDAQEEVIVSGMMFDAMKADSQRPDHSWVALGKLKSATPNPDSGFETIQCSLECSSSLTTTLTSTTFNTALLFTGASSPRDFLSYGEDPDTDGIECTGFPTTDSDKKLGEMMAGKIVLLPQTYS